jgi:hypothetical protein
MTKRTICFIVILIPCSPAFCLGQPEGDILKDGIALAGVDGKLSIQDNNNIYYFINDSEISEEKTVLKAQTPLEVLPSVALEKMLTVKKENALVGFRIWGRVTSYKGKNYIFVIHFLQLADTDSEKADSQQSLINEDANDPLKLPPEILEKMKGRKIIQPAQLKMGLEMEQDRILVDRTGFIRNDPSGRHSLVFDSIGKNIENISITLLPCYTLESSAAEQKKELEEIRFNVSGIVTKYKGGFYLLLQRTSRAYSYGNFNR